MRAAKGTGVISSVVLESDDLDEIDWVSAGLPTRKQSKANDIAIGMAWWK
jgi:hypothetical protein